MKTACRAALLTAAVLLLPVSVQAHFIWLVPAGEAGHPIVSVRFGEDASDDDPEYLSFVKGMSLSMVMGDKAAVPMKVTTTDEAVFARVNEVEDALFVAAHDVGVMDRGDSVFRLKYYAKSGPPAESSLWQSTICSDDIQLDVVPAVNSDKVTLTVSFNGSPAKEATINVAQPGTDDQELTTDAAGRAAFTAAGEGMCSIRVRHVEAGEGTHKGKAYSETRHYCTIALDVGSKPSASKAVSSLQDLPQPVTSFGAAVVDKALYMYGGHTGSAHSYSTQEQSNQLTRLDLQTGEWNTVIDGPHLQGLALVTHGGKLYRIGGFTAKNAEGEDHDLWSQNSVACFDPAAGQWTELPSLPECRSSHDAAVVGDCIYVVGGWSMQGEDKQWHTTAWKMDLSQEEKSWQAIKAPPFQRRALAAAAHGGKLYVVGGMQEEGGPTTAVGIYDPATDSWSDGPSLVVKTAPEGKKGGGRGRMSSGGMTGFGASAFATGGSLYVTTVQGTLQQLAADGSAWKIVSKEVTPRFFHRLLPVDAKHLVAVGGANMSIGKFEKVDVIEVGAGS